MKNAGQSFARQFCTRHKAALGTVLLCAGVLAGCQIGPRNFLNENDRLREENLKLSREVEELQAQLDLRLGEIATLRQQSQVAATQPALQGAQPPVLAKLALDRLSGPVDTDGDGQNDLIRIYLTPLDQQGRLLPVAGAAHLQAVAIPAEGEPFVVADRQYDAKAFDDAWRSNFTGSHYTLELSLPNPLPQEVGELTVKITLTEAAGATLSTQKAFKVDSRDPTLR